MSFSDVRGQRLPSGHAYVIVGPDGGGGCCGRCCVVAAGVAVRLGFPFAPDRTVRRRFGPAARVQFRHGRCRPLLRPRAGSAQVRVAVRRRVLEQRDRVATAVPDRGPRGRQSDRRVIGRRRDGRHRVEIVQSVGRDVTVAAGRPVLWGEKKKTLR